jgi:putative endonuclease
MENYVYILFSENLNKFYIGQTSNLVQRMEFHRASKSSKFTGKANDWELFLEIPCQSKKQALAIEAHIKRMKSRIYIHNLKRYDDIINKLKIKYDC